MRSSSVIRLIHDLADPDPLVRVEALEGLEDFATRSEEVRGHFVRAMTDPHPWVRAKATQLMPSIELPADQAVRLLIRALKDPCDDVRIAAAAAIGKSRPSSRRAVAALVEAMGDTRICPAAIQALANIGPLSMTAVPALVSILKAGDFAVLSRRRRRRVIDVDCQVVVVTLVLPP
jgi:HEAT repeat protein